ncbi:MAG: hypothetical protein Q4G10_03945 [Bacteroidia bacterium]|nr:hypothetical protein [Bacteroidia bacterium]
MIKAFRVAEHTFQLEMPDAHPVWGALAQYAPFITDVSAGFLFKVSVVECLPECELVPLIVEEPEDGFSRIDLYDADGSYFLRMAPSASSPVSAEFLISNDMREGRLAILDRSASSSLFAVNNALMLLFAFATADRMTLEMHSSVIVNDGKGYMFLGRSGTGKSTHSSLWIKHVPDSELLNDDNPIIRIGDDGIARVYGSPWSGKTPCYRNEEVPIGAIVRINQAKENVLTRYGMLEAYASVYSSCSGFKADRRISDGLHRTLEHIALNVPCYKLDCRPDEEAALVCSEGVKS